MIPGRGYIVPAIGASALVATVFSTALANQSDGFRPNARAAARNQTVNGNLTVSNVAKIKKNLSVYGRLYAHGGQQVWQGLLVRSGGVKADSLDVTGPMAAQSATIANNLAAGTIQAPTINGTTLTLTGAATVGGTLTASGKVVGNGVDGGAGGVTTTGNVTASGISATGTLAAGSITTNGSLSAGQATFTNMAVSGNLNLTNATVTGLSVSNLSGATVGSLNIGTPSGTTAPLILSQNSKSASIGVSAGGALTIDTAAVTNNLAVGGNATVAGNLSTTGSAAIGGNLAVAGAGGIMASGMTAPVAGTGSNPGPLSFTGSAISLSGPVTANAGLTLANGGDLTLSAATNVSTPYATHIVAGTDRDVAGTTTITAASPTAAGAELTTTVNFIRSFGTAPVVTVTPQSNPNPLGGAPSVWVTLNQSTSGGPYSSFTLHYIAPNAVTTNAQAFAVTFAYHVVGS